ncbi:MAG: L-glutamate gamma-semialdehyde dehydrogenase [Actinomycetota bacterium]
MIAETFQPPVPSNEPVRPYAPGDADRLSLMDEIRRLEKITVEVPCVIGGEEVRTGSTFPRRAPHRHDLHLAEVHGADEAATLSAIEAARQAKPEWESRSPAERAAVFLRAAELLSTTRRDLINAATMLGQSKTIHQAEIDAACELIDFLRFNVSYYAEILAEQPRIHADGIWNRLDYRPLEGFVLAVTPFNFTAIAGNLPTAPAICGNTVVWKPSEKQALAAHYFMQVLEEAGLPPGVINLVHGDGALVSRMCFDQPDFGGLHFTGSLAVFRGLWADIGNSISKYRTFPRVVGETGGKDFVVAHRSARVDTLNTALVRGAFEYQGQKCSAASRAYIPSNLWPDLKEQLVDTTASLAMGDVADLSNFMGAVIDEAAFRRHASWLERAASDPDLEILVGGGTDDSDGWFVQPTVIETSDPRHEIMETELFGPIVTVFSYPEADWEETLHLVDSTSPYGLTGSVFAEERRAVETAGQMLRHAAGNFYVNDKPTGSVVGQQPFGGARASGTNDKAGSKLNMMRWLSPRSVKDNMTPPTDHTYPHMRPDL